MFYSLDILWDALLKYELGTVTWICAVVILVSLNRSWPFYLYSVLILNKYKKNSHYWNKKKIQETCED